MGVWPAPRRRFIVEFGESVHLELPDELKGRARQEAAQAQLAQALRSRVESTLANTDLRLPEDDGGRARTPKEES